MGVSSVGYEHRAETRRHLARVGLDREPEWQLLYETVWRLTDRDATSTWPGCAHHVATVASGSSDWIPNAARCDLSERAHSMLPAFCDVRAPRHLEAFTQLAVSRAQRKQLVRVSQLILSRRDAPTVAPLLVAARSRFIQDAESYVEVLDACDEALAVPRLLSERDRRQVRWLAIQVHGLWLTAGEATRHLRERLVLPYGGPEIEHWRAVIATSTQDVPV
jgi:hypothetical protein